MYGKPVDMCISSGRTLMLLSPLPIIGLGDLDYNLDYTVR